jgi:hypothetical protein
MPNSHRLLNLCLASTITQIDTMSIYQMSLALPLTLAVRSIRDYKNRISGKAYGLLVARHPKSFLPLIRSSSSP